MKDGLLARMWKNGSLRTHGIALLLPLAMNVRSRPNRSGFISRQHAMHLSGLSKHVFDNVLGTLGEEYIEHIRVSASNDFIHYRLRTGLLAEDADRYFVVTGKLFGGSWQELSAGEQVTLIALAAVATPEVWSLEDFFNVNRSDLDWTDLSIVKPAIGPDMARRVAKPTFREIARFTGMNVSSVSRSLARLASRNSDLLVMCELDNKRYYQMSEEYWAASPDWNHV